MITGQFREGRPFVSLDLQGDEIEFVVDTGFQGDLSLTPLLASRLYGEASNFQLRMLADGSRIVVGIYELMLVWQEEERIVEVVTLDGAPLLGTDLMSGCELRVQMIEGGEVVIEPL